ncbi:hypothetical protein QJS10_CPB19g00383 [Acorus calamus]|uniref:Uncharacterized protein n=1 Tax=Acorus calamus TaxID=4465 RepID=A0AAV9CHV0_ACOCL|nr:hypothetical protein QJS10_CPB19g00383 [Acorus calamus]
MYSASSLERSGSFRESMEHRTLNPGSALSRGSGGALLGEIPPPSQYMALEQISLGEQRYPRSGELRRALGVSLAVTSEEHPFIQSNKPISPVPSEEIKRIKASVLETYARARDRVKLLSDCIMKLEKYRQTILSRKRPRNDMSSGERPGGVNLLKTGSQIHQNPSDIVGQRLEDRTKSVVPNRRVRSSVAEVRSEGRNTALSRQAPIMDKDKNVLRSGNGPPVLAEDKSQGLPAGGDGWDKKMKRKRSVGTVISRSMDGDRELKQAVPQRLSNESRPRPCDGQGFRSGSSNGSSGINKLDGSSQTNVSSVRNMPRHDLEGISIPSDRRDAGLEKERLVPKGNTKMSVREDGQAGNPGPMTKGKGSRAPRSGSNPVANTANFARMSGGHDGWEQPPCLSKVQSLNGPNNRKRPMPTGSSSPPVWGGQRPQKSSRTRRTNLVSPVPNQEESQIFHDEFPVSEAGPKLMPAEGSGPMLSRVMSNSTPQFRLKLDNVSSPAGPSASEESGAAELKSKENGVENREGEERTINGVQRAASFLLPTKKNKLLSKEDIGDGVRRQGRTGRVSAHGRTSLPLPREKLEKTAMTKPVRRPEKGESKVGRPPSKKASDRKSFHRTGPVGNSGSAEFTGESEDDREELLEAANAARNASYNACSSSFWKNMEPYFAFLSSDDIAHFKHQLQFVMELDDSVAHVLCAGDDVMDELLHNITNSASAHFSGERQENSANAGGQGGLNTSAGVICSDDESLKVDKLCEKIETEKLFEKFVPLSQRLLAAFIIEDEMNEAEHNVGQRNAYMQLTGDESPYGMNTHVESGPKEAYGVDSEPELEFDQRTQKNCSCNGSTASNSFRSPLRNLLYNNEQWQENDVSVNSEFGNGSGFDQNNIHRAQPVAMNSSDICSNECQYQQMSLDERIALELHSIGLFPDAVPDIAEGDDDEISKEITRLKLGLYHQVRKMKGPLGKLDNTIQNGWEMEERNLEQLAIRQLVDMAYKKIMACRGGSGNKGGINKISKQVASAFAKRTLDRFQRYKDTGRSCFAEPVLHDVIFSAPQQSGETKCIDGISSKTPTSLHTEAHNCQLQSQPSGHVPGLVDRNGLINPKSERSSLDAPQVLTHPSDQAFAKYESTPIRGKKREVLLDDVGNAGPRATSTLANALSGGTKGKRSERERDQNKESSTRHPLPKAGRPSLSSGRGERKSKSKPKQKTAQLSASGHGLLVKPQEATDSVSRGAKVEVGVLGSGSIAQDLSKQNEEEPEDYSNLLNESDVLVPQNQDIGQWFGVDESGLDDNELIGLEIPTDDISLLDFNGF